MFPEGLEMLMGKGLAKMMRMVCPWKIFWHFFCRLGKYEYLCLENLFFNVIF